MTNRSDRNRISRLSLGILGWITAHRSPRTIAILSAAAVVTAGGLFGYAARNPQDSLRALPGVSANAVAIRAGEKAAMDAVL